MVRCEREDDQAMDRAGATHLSSGTAGKVLIRSGGVEGFLTKRQTSLPNLNQIIEETIEELRGTGS